MIRALLLFNLFLLSQVLFGQGYDVFTFDEQSEFSNTLIKSVTEDEKGFIWAATDGGLLRFDGENFTTFVKQLPSIYVKSVYRTRNNKLICVTDLGVGYFQHAAEKIFYSSIVRGTTSLSDSIISYPKAVYVDSKGRLWICDQNSTNQVIAGKLKKYDFGEKLRTDSYFRSFMLTEDSKGNLFLAAWRGAVFIYDEKNDKFIELPFNKTRPQTYINQISVFNDGEILLGTSYGITRLTYSNPFEITKQDDIVSLNGVSSFIKLSSNDLLIGSWGNGLHRLNNSSGRLTKETKVEVSSINNLYAFQSGIWIASDKGLILLKSLPFKPIGPMTTNSPLASDFIRNIENDSKGTVFFSDQESIFKIHYEENKISYENLYKSSEFQIYNFTAEGDNIWLLDRKGRLFFVKKNKPPFLVATLDDGARYTSLQIDKKGNLWAYYEQKKQIVRYESNFSKTTYDMPEEANISQKIFLDSQGRVMTVYATDKLNVLVFDEKTKEFSNLNLIQDQVFSDQVLIFDAIAKSKDTLLIATGIGLYTITGGKVLEPKLQSMQNLGAVRALAIDKNKLWVGTDLNLLCLEGENYSRFTKKNGLPVSAINTSGIAIDNAGRVWVGTSNGVAYLNENIYKLPKTENLRLTGISVNSVPISEWNKKQLFTGTTTLTISFSAPSFPSWTVYQTKLSGIQDTWSEETSTNTVTYYNIPPGEYTFSVRAQHLGSTWSDKIDFNFRVDAPWYARFFMIIAYVLVGILSVTYVVVLLNRRKLERIEKENLRLEKIVQEKTLSLVKEKELTEQLLLQTRSANNELGRMNNDLKRANEMSNNILKITSHDLKNPLSTILGFSEILQEREDPDPELGLIFKHISISAHRMFKIITELLDSYMLEGNNIVMRLERVDIVEILKSIEELYRNQVESKHQKLTLVVSDEVFGMVDRRWFPEVLDNLISNAIKYSPKHSEIQVSLIENESTIEIKVKDSGPGFSEEDIVNMYQKFKRLSARPTGGESSMGLGLAIAKEIVHLHHGTINLETNTGSGSTFTVTIPK